MAERVTWKLKGTWLKNCSCDPGCPCDFWAKPTQTFCEGMLGMHIQEGAYGPTPLSGLRFVVTYHWPGPLHEGHGTLQPFIDERAPPPQREALLTILSGKAGNPWFEVVASLVTTVHEPQFVPIRFEIDVDKRTGRVEIPGILETVSEPIRNIATGGNHRIQVVLPEGMEYRKAETARASVNRSRGAIRYDRPNGHSSLALVEQTDSGLKG